MKIAYLIAGTGGAFYCENCIRDHAFIAGLRANGHEVTTIPMYLPVKESGLTSGTQPVFFGAVRLYLTSKIPLLRNVPDALLKLLDHPSMLNLAASMANSTRAKGHEQMTIAMLKGEHGPFAHDFGKLSAWIRTTIKPDILIVSNAFLLGIAASIKSKSRIPIICMLQDEHFWVDSATPSYKDLLWNAVSDKFDYVDMALTHSYWFKEKFSTHVHKSNGKITVIPFGVDPSIYTVVSKGSDTLNLGSLGRICSFLGVEVIARAYALLVKDFSGTAHSLNFCGGFTKDDQAAINRAKKSVLDNKGTFTIHPEFGITDRVSYLQTLSVFSLPAQEPMTIGTSVIEAMACGIPVILPDSGGFPEILAANGGGVIYAPNTPDTLAEQILRLYRDTASRKYLAAAARNSVIKEFNNLNMAKKAIAVVR